MNDSTPLLAVCDHGEVLSGNEPKSWRRRNESLENLSGRTSSLVYNFLSCFNCCGTAVEVRSGYHVVLTKWGAPKEILREPSVYIRGAAGLEAKEIWKGTYQGRLTLGKCSDKNGVPLSISALYGWEIADTLKASCSNGSLSQIMKGFASSALLTVASRLPYDDPDGGVCLRDRPETVEEELKIALQDLVRGLGVRVGYFRIARIGVEDCVQEIMLARQQAKAYVQSRREVVLGALGILESNADYLRRHQIQLAENESKALTMDMLYMIANPAEVELRLCRRNFSALPLPEPAPETVQSSDPQTAK